MPKASIMEPAGRMWLLGLVANIILAEISSQRPSRLNPKSARILENSAFTASNVVVVVHVAK
jgi:hypothetical protein